MVSAHQLSILSLALRLHGAECVIFSACRSLTKLLRHCLSPPFTTFHHLSPPSTAFHRLSPPFTVAPPLCSQGDPQLNARLRRDGGVVAWDGRVGYQQLRPVAQRKVAGDGRRLRAGPARPSVDRSPPARSRLCPTSVFHNQRGDSTDTPEQIVSTSVGGMLIGPAGQLPVRCPARPGLCPPRPRLTHRQGATAPTHPPPP